MRDILKNLSILDVHFWKQMIFSFGNNGSYGFRDDNGQFQELIFGLFFSKF